MWSKSYCVQTLEHYLKNMFFETKSYCIMFQILYKQLCHLPPSYPPLFFLSVVAIPYPHPAHTTSHWHTWPQSLSIPFTSTKAALGHQDYSIYAYVFNVLCIYAAILTRNGQYLLLVWIFNSHPPLVNFTYGSTDVYDILHSLAFPAHCGRSSFSILYMIIDQQNSPRSRD